ncbi:Formation of crista junctions protein 1 [Serendipita sp. 398]|nr:Formation of crista junctions protein 1 [Serendipita sp. 398]
MSSGLRRPLAIHATRTLSFSSARVHTTRARFITSSSRTFNTTGTSSATIKPKKKRRIIRTTLIYSTLLVATGYGLGTAAALNNEQAHDWFTEKVPFGEEIVDFAELQGFVGGLPRGSTPTSSPIRRQRPTPSSPQDPQPEPPNKHEKMEALKAKVDKRVKEKKERLRDITTQIPTHAEKGEPHGIAPTHISSTKPAPLPPAHYSEGVEELVKEPPKKVPKSKAGLLLVAPAVAEFKASEPLLDELATTVDNLAKYLEDNPKAERGVNKILDVAKKDLVELATKIEKASKDSKEELEKHLEQQRKEYSGKLLEAEMTAQDKLDAQDEEWRKYFDQERLSLLEKYQEKLDNELTTQKDLINERLKEEVIAQGIELQRRWIRDVELYVEEERGGRLAKLEEVATGLKKLERLTLDNALYLDENLRLHAVWSALRALSNVTTDSPTRRPFREELHVLKSVASAAGTADDAVMAVIDSLESSDAPDIGLEPLADLAAWFTTSVAPRFDLEFEI